MSFAQDEASKQISINLSLGDLTQGQQLLHSEYTYPEAGVTQVIVPNPVLMLSYTNNKLQVMPPDVDFGMVGMGQMETSIDCVTRKWHQVDENGQAILYDETHHNPKGASV